ncbi:peptidyl-prolyl cis-trans isomerase CWC27-like [Achlya hypogyna]|uniref:Peptidyl-prolyl cis-trans isomerase CWC27-like n=1 Tax=Achlya hypogyna TaxID=1202772 RepID=A0A1V9ZJ55_ACHHY|nr:peptidyl-prolyl cis-trans isomerase CWC27-like [Achlya hypogyna]
MSNIYITEPDTEGKVLMRTSFGDLDIEFWPKQAPKAVRNFFQLAMEHYYDNTLFHRIIANFMIQGGDPTGTGDGGESVYGEPFMDEFHSRLRFNHRGLLAMANSNKPNTNQSQFFFTLDKCDFLDRKHTIFGKITGNTIFNLLTVNDMETGRNERPLEPVKLLGIEILWNPFTDIVPRAIKAASAPADAPKPKNKRKATKDLKLLSFGDDAEDAFAPTTKKKGSMSSHDILKNDKKLSARVDASLQTKIALIRTEDYHDEPLGDTTEDLRAAAGGDVSSLKALIANKLKKKPTNVHTTAVPKPAVVDEDIDDVVDEKSRKKAKKAKKKAKDEYTALKEELKKSNKAVHVVTGAKAKKLDDEKAFHEMLTPLQMRRQKYLAQKKSIGERQANTLERLEKFRKTLVQQHSLSKAAPKKPESESYHGQVLSEDSDAQEDGDNDDKGWMTAKLKFKKHIDDQYRMGYDPNTDNYMTIDTKIEANKR